MRPDLQAEYIVGALIDAGSMYEDDARAFLAEHDRHVRTEVLHEAADFVGNDDDCDCGGCDTCYPRKLAEGLREMAGGQCNPTPLVVARFDTAMEPALEEEQVFIVGAIAEDGRPVALCFDVEDRAKVGGWLKPAAVSPDLHDAVLRAVGSAKGPLLPLPVGVQRILAEHVTNAVAPLVPYREVWDTSLPPGGRVCNICGQPVESEPCPEHAPDFFKIGHTYRHHSGGEFRCLALDPHPQRGDLYAIGWLIDTDGTCVIFRLAAPDWESGRWTDVTGEAP